MRCRSSSGCCNRVDSRLDRCIQHSVAEAAPPPSCRDDVPVIGPETCVPHEACGRILPAPPPHIGMYKLEQRTEGRMRRQHQKAAPRVASATRGEVAQHLRRSQFQFSLARKGLGTSAEGLPSGDPRGRDPDVQDQSTFKPRRSRARAAPPPLVGAAVFP